jgi:outer membrane protein assembly factor BamD (BamD/ComL family)
VARKRIKRKDLKRPDDFITLTGRVVAWGRRNTGLVIGLSVAAAVLLVGAGLLSAYASARQRDANSELGRALATLEARDYANAAQQFEALAERRSSSDIADAALQAVEKLAAEEDRLPGYLQQELLFTWASALEEKQRWPEAADKYAAAAALEGPYTGPAVLAEAQIRERAGEADRAMELYRKFHEQFPNLPGRDLASAKLGASS